MRSNARSYVAVLGAVLSLAVGAAACSDPAPRPPPAGDGMAGLPPPVGGGAAGVEGGLEGGVGEAGEAGEAGPVDAGACNTIDLTGQLVDRVGVIGDPPVSTGGTVVDGTYELTQYSVYVGAGGVGGPTGISARSSMRIAGGKIDQILELSGSGPTTQVRSTRAYNVAGATFATTELCPNIGGGGQQQFTANDALLVLTDGATKEAFTFVRR